MVYVDNVAQAIVQALAAPAEAAIGQTFAISDGNEMTWLDFYGYFAHALGVPLPLVSGVAPAAPPARRRGPLRWLRAWLSGWKAVLTSAEAKSLARKYLQTDPVGNLPRALLERSPWLERGLRRLFKLDRPLVYRPPAADPAPRIVMNPREAFVNPGKARRVLGFAPAVPVDRALELTLAWIRHARLVPGPPA
jgi:nucleoside-diphosphate-sugar epimerase